MRITILNVGESKFSYLKEGEAQYLKRLAHYIKIEYKYVKPEKVTKSKSEFSIRKLESKRLRSKISDKAFVCALDSQGKMLTSEMFAQKIQSWRNRNVSNIVFCIGGPLGLEREFISQSDFVLSLSRMTFPHDLVRLMFLEQLYRAFTILNCERYHK